MAVTNTPTTLASRLKQRYAKETSNIVPMTADLIKRLKFRQDVALGASAEFDVQLTPELGFSVGQGSVTLNGALAQVAARATVSAYSLILQSRVAYDLISRAKTDDRAFARFGDSKFLGMVESFRNREEWLALCGRRSLGKIESVNSNDVVITPGTWNPTIWASLAGSGASIKCFDSLTGTTEQGSGLAVAAVVLSTRTVTFTNTNMTNVGAGDFLFFPGQHDAGRIGLMDIAYNTGTLYGISAATYPLWSANSYDAGTSALTLGKILAASAKSAEKGCVGEKLVCYVPVKTFQSLVADEATLVRHGASKKASNGFEELEFFGASGTISVVPHLFMKDGEAVLFPEDYCSVIGSQDATANIAKDGDIIFDLESTSDKEMRMFSDTCGVFCEKPGYITYITRSDAGVLDS